MKLPRRFVTKLSLATVLAASAGLGWATPDAMAGLVLSAPVVTTDQSGEGGQAQRPDSRKTEVRLAAVGDDAPIQIHLEIWKSPYLFAALWSSFQRNQS